DGNPDVLRSVKSVGSAATFFHGRRNLYHAPERIDDLWIGLRAGAAAHLEPRVASADRVPEHARTGHTDSADPNPRATDHTDLTDQQSNGIGATASRRSHELKTSWSQIREIRVIRGFFIPWHPWLA